MNAMQFLSAQPWVERLGWTLVHFLWQGLLIAALYAAVRRSLVRTGPNSRYLLACFALAAMAAAPLITWSVLRPADSWTAAARVAGRAASAAGPLVTTLFVWPQSHPASAWPQQLWSWIVAAWLAGSLVFWLRMMAGWVVAARMRSMLVRPAPPEWQRTLSSLAAQIGVSRPVRLLVSALVAVPVVVGWLRPLVLVPVGALAGLPAAQMEALLLHELAHIRRHDYLVNILQSVAEALLFYHPAVWWISAHIRAERELCCDDVAASATGDALTYVQALAELESCRPAHVHAALAANGGSLAHRIARLLGQSRPTAPAPSGAGAALAAILLAATACGLLAQSNATPRFEVASIKQQIGGDRRGMRVRVLPGGGLMTENASLQILMQNAYTMQSFQISAGPGWYQSDGWNIEAKGDGKPATQAEVYRKLRSLLEDRFQLKVHHETKELPVYALTVAKNGPKLPQPKEGGCIVIDPNAPPPRPAPGQFPCGAVGVMGLPAGARIRGGQAVLPEFVRILAMVMGKPVLDRTGLSGNFDITLDFAVDESEAGLQERASANAGPPLPPPDPSGPPQIFTAIQEQLGLKLEPAKGPVDILVIDHVERPSAN